MKTNPDALARVHFFPSEAGGRAGPTPPRAFGCIMVIGDRNLDVRLRLEPAGPLRPGESRELGLDFLDPEFARPYVRPGVRFELREARAIGDGEIRQVFVA